MTNKFTRKPNPTLKIDDFLSMEDKKNTEELCFSTFCLRLPKPVHEQLKLIAQAKGLSINGIILNSIYESLNFE